MLFVALLSPVMGAIADYSGAKVKFLSVFALIGALATMFMALIGHGDWLLASILVILGTIGFSAGNTFYDGLLTDIAPPEKRDALSAQGYALGYLGGGLLLAVNLVMIEGWEKIGFPDKTTATQIAFITVGIWWLVFSIPIVRHVKESAKGVSVSYGDAIESGFMRIGKTMQTASRYPELLKYMAAFWFFNDGINTVIVMATIYGSGIGIGTSDLILALLITQFVGFPSTLLFVKITRIPGWREEVTEWIADDLRRYCNSWFLYDQLHAFLFTRLYGWTCSRGKPGYCEILVRQPSTALENS